MVMIATMMLRSNKNRRNTKYSDDASNANDDDSDATYGFDETKRIVDVLDKQLERKEFVCAGEYTIADMAIFPWIRCLSVFYKAGEFLQLQDYKNVQRWMGMMEAREAVKRGLRVNGFGDDAVKERHSKADFD
jgi:GST-like protein